MRREKTGDWSRAQQRVEQWARWKLAQSGHIAPNHATMVIRDGFVVFIERREIKPRYEELRGPRGGHKGWKYHPGYYEDAELDFPTLKLPEHCKPVRDADAWHAEHQASRRRYRKAA